MIELVIKIENEKVLDSLNYSNTTLVENAIVLRRLEEMKEKLLKIEYSSDIDISENGQ
jgi:hypothetical protein